MPYRPSLSEAAAVDWIARKVETSVRATNLPVYSGLRSSIQEVTGSERLGLLNAANSTSLTMQLQLQSYEPASV